MSFMSFSQIAAEQKKPLDYKIDVAVGVLREALALPDAKIGLAFSGGKDSTVLWDLMRRFFPDASYTVLYGNTGVEFPECLKFARQRGKEWAVGGVSFIEVLPERLEHDELKYEAQREILEWLVSTGEISDVLKPDGKLSSTKALERKATPEMMADFERRGLIWKAGTRKHYWYCVDQYGWPILGKSACVLTAKRINIDCFLRFSSSASQKDETKQFYDLLREVKISNHCCSILKKQPMEHVQAELGINVCLKGLMASESHARKLSFSSRGYIFESSRPYAQQYYHVSPLEIWTDDDIWAYIHRYNVPYAPLYDMEYTDSKGVRRHVKRNGCCGCATDIAFSNNHMSIMHQTHPHLWDMYMRKGLADELVRLQHAKGCGTKNYIDVALSASDVIERRPCAFDEIDDHIVRDVVTSGEYDAEL